MAQKVFVSLVDDLDGGKSDETVQFPLDGKHYEIDLSNNATALRDALTDHVGSDRGRIPADIIDAYNQTE
jgi:hypothetical protein